MLDRKVILLENLKKSVSNLDKRMYVRKNNIDEEMVEIINESIIQTYEIAIELAWKTVRAYALEIEPSGKVAGSTTAIKLGLATGVVNTDELARDLINAVQYRNMSSHEYLLESKLDEYVEKIDKDFLQVLKNLIESIEVL